jgi:hypothetical protein
VRKLYFVLRLVQHPTFCDVWSTVHLLFIRLKQKEEKSRYVRKFPRYSHQSSTDPGSVKISIGALVKSQMTSKLMRIS